MASVTTQWQISGDYFENCSCDVLCPCEVSSQPMMTSKPTYGVCDVTLALHIDHGNFGATPLDNLNAVIAAHTPGPMANGNWSAALYIDERADDAQRQALQTILTGQVGGPMAMLAPLIGTMLGVRFVPISHVKDGTHRTLEIPDIAHVVVSALPGPIPGKEMTLSGVHPFNFDTLTLAVGDQGSTFQDFGMSWNNSGRNGHYAPINWGSGS